MFDHFRSIPYLLLYLTLIFMSACVSHSSTEVTSFATGAFSQIYQFAANPDYLSKLQLTMLQDNITYSAQISTSNGKIVTTVDQTILSNMEFTIPKGDEQFYINIATEQENWLEQIDLSIKPVTNSGQSDLASNMNIAFSSQSDTNCEIWIAQENIVYVYAQPSTNAQALFVLPINIPFIADARTIDGWYRLTH